MFTSLRKIPRNIWALSLTSFFRDVASEMLVHLLPLFLANVLGIRTAVIGLIEGVAETTASLMKIYSGWHSDSGRFVAEEGNRGRVRAGRATPLWRRTGLARLDFVVALGSIMKIGQKSLYRKMDYFHIWKYGIK